MKKRMMLFTLRRIVALLDWTAGAFLPQLKLAHMNDDVKIAAAILRKAMRSPLMDNQKAAIRSLLA